MNKFVLVILAAALCGCTINAPNLTTPDLTPFANTVIAAQAPETVQAPDQVIETPAPAPATVARRTPVPLDPEVCQDVYGEPIPCVFPSAEPSKRPFIHEPSPTPRLPGEELISNDGRGYSLSPTTRPAFTPSTDPAPSVPR